MEGFLWEDCEWDNVSGEGIYAGNNKADPRIGEYLIRDVTIRNCQFKNCGEGIGIAGCIGYEIIGNTILDTTAPDPPARRAAIAVGRNSVEGRIAGNTISRSRGSGMSLTVGDGPLVIEGNLIEEVGLGAGDPALKSNIYGLRFTTGTEVGLIVRNNKFNNIKTAGIDISSNFVTNDRSALIERLEQENEFVNCAGKVS